MIILRQKEFGFIQDVRRSGLGRTMKRNIGRFRERLANKLEKSIDKDIIDLEKASKNSVSFNDIDDRNKELLIAKEIARNNGKTLEGSFGGLDTNITYVNPKLISNNIKDDLAGLASVKKVRNNFEIKAREDLDRKVGNQDEGNIISRYLKYRKYEKGRKKITDEFYKKVGKQRFRELNKINNSIKSGKSVVVHTKGSGLIKYAHEAGHVKNANSQNKLTKLISDIAGSKDARLKNNLAYIRYNEFDGGKKSNLRDLFKSIRDNSSIILEESNASRKGYKILKDLGIENKDLNEAKKFYNTALDTYKKSAKIDIKNTLKNIISLKSRAGNMSKYRKEYGTKKAREIMKQKGLDYKKYLKDSGID